MNLQDTLFVIENFLGIDTDTLLPLAQADNIGGYHPEPSQRQWGSGAIWDVEGRALYALIRALKPEIVVEVGSGTGCSTNHIASALAANGKGHVTTIDRGNTPQIPDYLQPFVTVLPGDAFDYLEAQPDNSIDFILEDADHSEAMCYRVGELAKTKLAPGGVLLAHDAAHFGVGADVRAGFTRAGLDYRVYLTEPSDCGWLVWQRAVVIQMTTSEWKAVSEGWPDEYKVAAAEIAASLADTEPVLQAQEDEPPTKPKAKRKPARKAKTK